MLKNATRKNKNKVEKTVFVCSGDLPTRLTKVIFGLNGNQNVQT